MATIIQYQFQNKVGLVTGAGVGIGFEIARQMALSGIKVVLNDLDGSRCEKAVEAIRLQGGTCHAFPGDMSEVAHIRSMIKETVNIYGQLDFAIANAGITSYGDFFDFTPAAFQRLLAVNLQGSFFLAQAAAQQYRNQKTPGKILFMSSVTAHQAHQYLAAYGMTKAGLEMLAKGLVIELAPYHITINTIAPGATLTERTLNDEPDYKEKWARVIPTGKPASPETIAQVALFLLSSAADHINGQSLLVDGGWTATSPLPDMSNFK